jgi:hypothetical protein
MFILTNIITLCEYIINNVIGSSRVQIVGYENIEEVDEDKYDPRCQCNLCYGFRNFMLFLTHRLKYRYVVKDYDLK